MLVMMGATRFRPRSQLWEFLALGLYAEATSRGKRNEWTSYLFIVRRETLWLACAVKVHVMKSKGRSTPIVFPRCRRAFCVCCPSIIVIHT